MPCDHRHMQWLETREHTLLYAVGKTVTWWNVISVELLYMKVDWTIQLIP